MMPILILGVEDHRATNLLWANVRIALEKLGLDHETTLVDDIERIIDSGISGIPALLVDGEVVSQKLIPSVDELEIILSSHLLKKNQL